MARCGRPGGGGRSQGVPPRTFRTGATRSRVGDLRFRSFSYGFSYRYSGFGLQGPLRAPRPRAHPDTRRATFPRSPCRSRPWSDLGLALSPPSVAIAAFAGLFNSSHGGSTPSTGPLATASCWPTQPGIRCSGWWPWLVAAVLGNVGPIDLWAAWPATLAFSADARRAAPREASSRSWSRLGHGAPLLATWPLWPRRTARPSALTGCSLWCGVLRDSRGPPRISP